MPLAKCRQCSAEVSDQAVTCPKCGVSKPVAKTSLGMKIVKIFVGLIVLSTIANIIVFGFFGDSDSTTSGRPPVASATVSGSRLLRRLVLDHH